MADIWNALPESVRKILEHSPFAVVLVAIIYALMTGYLVTGRTFDRELKQCEDRATEYKQLAFRGARDLNEQVSERAVARHQPTVTPLRDAEAPTLKRQLEDDEQALKRPSPTP